MEKSKLFDQYRKSVLDLGFTDSEVIKIIRFYLVQYIDKKVNDYGWKGFKLLSLLEKRLQSELINCTSIFQEQKTIESILKRDEFKDSTMINQSNSVLIVQRKKEENKIDCLLRHIRNAIAHSKIYSFPSGNIMLEDKVINGLSTARILLHKEVLLRWIDIIQNGGK